LEIAKFNVDNLELNNVEIINIDVLKIPKSFFKKFDIILTNPPFGIRSEKGADIKFLKIALNVIGINYFRQNFFILDIL
jgi:predicted RNA methylase